ncbi:hypothetical protein BKA57DRAFT_531805 [Linnemannia elongata]|nr:hypothetical protein BKA57DRAFT_531805 [Linnemannia elongata]
MDRVALIRSLTIDIANAGWFLNNLKPCSNLSEFHCADLENLPKPPRTNPIALSPIVDQTNNPLLMIGTNPDLHTLTFEKINWQYRADHFTESVFRFLVTHKSLTRLKLHLGAIPHSFLNNFFNGLPVSLQNLEFRFETFYHTPLAREFRTPADFRTTPLPCLKRLCLPGKRQRVTSHWDQTAEHPPRHWRAFLEDYFRSSYVVPLLQRMPRLREFVLRKFHGRGKELMQVLVDFCPDLETIDLYINESQDSEDGGVATDPLRGTFAQLNEFRMQGSLPEVTQLDISLLVARSRETLEIVWLHGHNFSNLMFASPFHIGTKASWTQCTRLKELVLHRWGRSEAQMTDSCWNIPGISSPSAGIVEEDDSMMFPQLEKLRLTVKEPLWEKCPDKFGGCVLWEVEGYFDVDGPEYYPFNDDWTTPAVALRTKEDDIWDRELAADVFEQKRVHQMAFIIHVREVYGRIKTLKQLQDQEIEGMTLELAEELFYRTEYDDVGDDNAQWRKEYPRTAKGWWGEITRPDLIWLGLRRPSLSEERKQAVLRHRDQFDWAWFSDAPYQHLERYTTILDPLNQRVGRSWEDWTYLVGPCRNHWSVHECRIIGASGNHYGCKGKDNVLNYDSDGYDFLDQNHIVFSRQFDHLSLGMTVDKDGRWGSRKANRVSLRIQGPLQSDVVTSRTPAKPYPLEAWS